MKATIILFLSLLLGGIAMAQEGSLFFIEGDGTFLIPSEEQLAEMRQGERQHTDEWKYIRDYIKNDMVTSLWRNLKSGEEIETIGFHAPSKLLILNETGNDVSGEAVMKTGG